MISIKQLATSILISITMISAEPINAKEGYLTPEQEKIQAEMMEKHKDIPHQQLLDLATAVSGAHVLVEVGYWTKEEARKCIREDAERQGLLNLYENYDEMRFLPAYRWLEGAVYQHSKEEFPDKKSAEAAFGKWEGRSCG